MCINKDGCDDCVREIVVEPMIEQLDKELRMAWRTAKKLYKTEPAGHVGDITRDVMSQLGAMLEDVRKIGWGE